MDDKQQAPLTDRVAVVTGGANGIGKAVAARLAREGATVAIADLDGPAARQVLEEVGAAGVWPCDVAVADEVGDAFDAIASALGPVDILVNNAGIWRHTPVLEADEEEWDRVFAVNVKGLLHCSRAVAPRMISRRCGRIVNVASVAGFGGSDAWSAYCASKAAALSLTLALANALSGHGVRVDAVCPGATRTGLLEEIVETEPGSAFDWVHDPDEVAAEVVDLIVPFDGCETGRVVAMKPADTVLGIPVGS